MRLGILGTGKIVKEVIPVLNQIPQIELLAVCNVRSDIEVIQGFANEYKIKSGYNNIDEFLSSEIDAVYVALPNSLHYSYTKQALKAGLNVIVEKPFTTNDKEAFILSELAKEKKLFLFEAITNQYLPDYRKIKECLPLIGDIKIVQCNYSQYSSRYDSFMAGEILPAFDPNYAGGALMDLNIYNIHYVVGLFGEPKEVMYYPNVEKGIDTSGILILSYEAFQCVCIAAKDCKAPVAINIQGDKGCIYQNTPPNVCDGFEIFMNDGGYQSFHENSRKHRMSEEFIAFTDMISKKNLAECYQMLDHSLCVCKVQTTAREKSGLF